jgi:S-adenosylmethionine hydrolase
MTKPIPTVALLTDFGMSDQYVGVVKGILLSHCPRVRIIDLCHDVGRHSISAGAYLLWSSYRYLPAATVVLAVVDPGVGTARDILLMKTKQHLFVAPDNGLLDLVLWQEQKSDLYTLDVKSRFVRAALPKAISATFHARDILAPVCALLASGIGPEQIGRKVIRRSSESPFMSQEDTHGPARILHVDHFGNIITNIMPAARAKSRFPQGIKVGQTSVTRWIQTYTEALPNTPSLIVGSSGLVEIVMNQQSAAARLLMGADSVEVIR